MNHRFAVVEPPPARTSFVLDSCWPEYASMVAANRQPDAQVLAPGFGWALLARYDWPGAIERPALLATARRHFDMRRVAWAPGNVRQEAYLRNDRAVARALASAIDYRCGHLVVAQTWLPWLEETGALGGRSFDVLMSRFPLAEIHRLLDAAAAEMPRSMTIRDFRAPPELVERETRLLEMARRIITPHHALAGLFGEKAVPLSWHRRSSNRGSDATRVAFLGPTIGRQRPDIAREICRNLDEPLIVLGDLLEQPCWDGIAIERRNYGPGWLEDVGAILHPAVITNEPRRLLEALAAGVKVYADKSCGLAPEDYLPLEEFDAA
jgi:hypothetical protein